MLRRSQLKAIQSLFESCDKEAIRLIMNSPTWIPAVDLETNKGVEMLYRIPIHFYSKRE